MQKYLITTQSYTHVLEEEKPTEFGYLIETDFDGHHRLLAIDTPVANPYGERIKPGLRGLYYWDGLIYAASWNTIFMIDPQSFEVVDQFSHPLMADLHGLHVDERGMWVTSSLMDLVLKFDLDRNLMGVLQVSNTEIYPEDIRQSVDLTQDYRLRGKRQRGFHTFHANHVTPLNKRYMLVTGRGNGGNAGKILRVDRETLEHRVWIEYLHGPHDGLFLNFNTFVLTETNGSSLAFIHRRSPRRTPPYFGVRQFKRLDMPSGGEDKFWTRGLCLDEQGNLMIGKSVWSGSDTLVNASILRMKPSSDVIAEHFLDFLGNYPECRIFQIIPAP